MVERGRKQRRVGGSCIYRGSGGDGKGEEEEDGRGRDGISRGRAFASLGCHDSMLARGDEVSARVHLSALVGREMVGAVVGFLAS